MTMRIHGDKIEFPDGTEQFTASSGGGGEAQPPVYAQTNLDANKSVSGGTEVFLNMNEELSNSGDFDTSGGNFRALKDGIYKFEYQVAVQSDSNGTLEAHYTYVKVNNVVNGLYYIILEKLDDTEVGNFSITVKIVVDKRTK